MRQLNAELRRSDPPAMRDNMGKRIFAGVRIEAEAAMGDPTVAFDMGGFNNKQAGAGIGEHAEMSEMPIIGDAVIGAVLAHRRYDDTIRKRQVGKLDRREQRTRHRCHRLEGWAGRTCKRENGAMLVVTFVNGASG